MNIDDEIAKIKSESNSVIKARLICSLYKTGDVRLKTIAEKLNMSPVAICNLIRIVKLPDIVIDGYYSDSISLTHLFIISRLKNEEDMAEVFETALAHTLTTAQTEALVREKLYSIKTDGEYLSDTERSAIIEKIRSIEPQFDVKIIQTRVRSKVVLLLKGNLKTTTKNLKRLVKL